MSDAQRTSMARIKLVGNAKCFFKKKLCVMLTLGAVYQILLWDQMRDILKEKYVPSYNMDDLLDQFLNIMQNTSTVTKNMSQFEALRCEVDESKYFLCLAWLII